MNLSIAQVLTIRQRDYRVLNQAFSVALGYNYSSKTYALTSDDARKVAAEIEKMAGESENFNGYLQLSDDQKWRNIKDVNQAAEAFRDLMANTFGL